MSTLFSADGKSQVFLGNVPLSQLKKHERNPRNTVDDKRLKELAEHIKTSGYDVTRAVKVVRVGDELHVFAGNTRRLASEEAGLDAVPAFEFIGYSDDEIWKFAYDDNTNDGKHTNLPITDVWADYAKAYEGGMTQQAIADALGVDRTTVVRRTKWHSSVQGKARQAVCDGMLEEGHLEAISTTVCDVALSDWLTSEQAQSELLEYILSNHVGKTVGAKPTVKKVREEAARWKEFIAEAENVFEKLAEPYSEQFVKLLIESKARSLAAVTKAKGVVLKRKAEDEKKALEEQQAQANQAEKDALRQKRIDEVLAKVVHGDALQLIEMIPEGTKLLLTDPPYGMNYQSNYRVVSPRKEKIANDANPEAAAALVHDILVKAYARMAEDSTVFVFTGWRYEDLFRQAVEDAGFEIKGSLIWVRGNTGMGDLKGAFSPQHDRIIHATKGRVELTGRPADVLEAKDTLKTGHPTEKPISLLRTLIEATTSEGDVVVDPFAGSGSTAWAAWDTKRDFRTFELNEGYFDSLQERVLKRIEKELEQ